MTNTQLKIDNTTAELKEKIYDAAESFLNKEGVTMQEQSIKFLSSLMDMTLVNLELGLDLGFYQAEDLRQFGREFSENIEVVALRKKQAN